VNLTVSQPIRILALVGILAIAALGGTTMLLGRSHPATATKEPAPSPVRHVPAAPAPAPAAHTPAMHAEPTAPAKPAVAPARPAKTAGATTHKTAKTAAPKRHGNLVYADLPAPLQWQLSQHKIVVVSLYNPNSNVDEISVAEAHQGALDAGAGFLLVSVLNDKIAGILTALLPGGGLLPAPGILVYRAPGNVALRIDGFADRATVAQAAQNAFAGANGPAPEAPAPPAAPPVVAPPATVTP
jgi:hypothetical protein